jgi:hypothetical protein
MNFRMRLLRANANVIKGCRPRANGRLTDLRQGASNVSRSNILYLIVGALVVGVAILGYQLYQDRHQPEGLNINVGPNGLSIQGKGK